jgi:hypothetical protein
VSPQRWSRWIQCGSPVWSSSSRADQRSMSHGPEPREITGNDELV